MLRNRSPNRSHNNVYKKFSPKTSGKENSGHSIASNQKNIEKSEKKGVSGENYLNVSIKCEPMELKPKVKNPLFKNKSARDIPIPRGNTPYCKAKKAEYVERDLAKAEKFYRQAIESNERLESAIKDLATVLHQQGKTEEACKFLEEHRKIYTGDLAKYDNLLLNLKKQIVPSGNCLNRTLVLFDISDAYDKDIIKKLFSNSSRILSIEFKRRQPEDESIKEAKGKVLSERFCLIHFASYSAARKTLETLKDEKRYQFYWMNIYCKIAGKADLSKNPIDEPIKKSESIASLASFEETGSTSKIESDNEEGESLESLTENESEAELEPAESLELQSVVEEVEVEDLEEESIRTDCKPLLPQEIKALSERDIEIRPPAKLMLKPLQQQDLNLTFNPNSECWNKTILASISDEFDDKWPSMQSPGPCKEDAIPLEIANKPLEPEDTWESFIWRRKLAKAKEAQKLAKPRVPIFEQVKKCESDIKSKIGDDNNFVHNLLQSLIDDDKEEKSIKPQTFSTKGFFNFNDDSNFLPRGLDIGKFNSPPNMPSKQFPSPQRFTFLPQTQTATKKSAFNSTSHSLNQQYDFKPNFRQNSSNSPTFYGYSNFQGSVNQVTGQQFTNFL